MNKLKIEFIAPSGKELNHSSNQEFIERITSEINLFSKGFKSEEIKPNIKMVDEGNGGLPEFVDWVINFYHNHSDDIKLGMSFISNLRLVIKMFWGEKSNVPAKKEDNKVIITYNGKSITLPNTDEKFNEFIKSLN